MNLNHFEAIQAVQKLAYRLTPRDHQVVEVTVHPPFTDLRSVQTVIDSDDIPIGLGAQNCHWETHGAYTGEVSAAMLAKLNVSYVIVGHSERRQLFGEDDEMVARKLAAVLAQQMTPILCVGETLDEHDAGLATERVTSQLRAALSPLGAAARTRLGSLVVAYEPIWAIGTGRNATPADAQEICARIRSEMAQIAGAEVAAGTRIQYGGSVRTSNAEEIMAQPDIDGALVGGASLDPDSFALIVHSGAEQG